ncbi:MAG: hypothetical protein KDC46_07885 [Thermoleophilia bacterium]|nr:hypothetical protein [Thermoleophilia bacterium]
MWALMLAAPAAAQAAMTIDSGPTVRVNPNQVTIWWHSSSTGSSELRWDTESRGDFASFGNDVSNNATNLGTLHSRTISNLPAGEYYFRVRTTGAAGTATSGTHRFVVRESSAASPRAGFITNGTVNAVATTATRTYLGGDFTQVGEFVGNGVTVDPVSAARRAGTPQVIGSASAAVPDGSGGVYIAGTISSVGGLRRVRVAHLLADGGVDPYFDPGTGPGNTVQALQLSGSRLYIGGGFTTVQGASRRRVAALDATTGDLDTSFDPGTAANNWVAALAIDGGRLYIGGSFTTFNGSARVRVAAVDASTGALDASFNPGAGANGSVDAIAVGAGRLYLGGSFTTYGGAAHGGIVAVDSATAAVDVGFNAGVGVDCCVTALAIGGGKLYLAGGFSTYAGTARNRLAAVDATTGALDGTFLPGAGTNSAPYALSLSGTRLYLAGGFDTYAGTARSALAAVDATTAALDMGFSSGAGIGGFYDTAYSIAATTNGVFVGGTFDMYDATPVGYLAALDASTGHLDATFNTGTGLNASVSSFALTGTRLYIAGGFTTYDGTPRARLAAVDPATGALDAGFNPGTGPSAAPSALEASGTRLFLTGSFTSYNGTGRQYVAAVDAATGVLDAGFNPGTGPNAAPGTLAVDGSRVLIGGWFTSVSGTPRQHVAALNATTGALDAGFNPGAGADNAVLAITVVGGRAYLGGCFTTYGGTARHGIAAVDAATGTLDAGFDPGSGVDMCIYDFASTPTRLYFGGVFSSYDGVPRNSLAAVDPATGALVSSFDPGAGASGAVQALSVNGTRIVMGGNFSSYGAVPLYGIATVDDGDSGVGTDAGPLAITTAAQHNIAPYQTTVWWSTSSTSSSELVWDTQSRSTWSEYQNDVSNSATNLGTVHSRTIGNLPQGTYYYRVRSRNAAGEQVTSGEYSFRVEPPDAATPLGSTVTNGVRAIATTPERVYLGGAFTQVGTRLGGGIRVDATTARLQAGSPQIVGDVIDSVPDGSGGWFIGGDFTRVGGIARARIAHLLPDGGVDPYFDPGTGFDDGVEVLLRVGSTLYAGGNFVTYDGVARGRVAALDTTTAALDATFSPGTGFNDYVFALAASGGKLYVGGRFTDYAGTTRNRVAALDATTAALDATFDPGVGFDGPDVYAFEVHGATLIVAGNFTSYAGSARNSLAALNLATAALDATFNPGTGFNSGVRALEYDGSRLYAGGTFTSYDGTTRNRIAVLDPTTAALDPTFDPGGGFDALVYVLELDGGTLYAGGKFTTYAGSSRNGLAALNATTAALDTTFDPGTGCNDYVRALTVSGSTLHVGGAFTTYEPLMRPGIAAIDATTGVLDQTFDPGSGFDGVVRALVADGNTLYAGGAFTTYRGISRPNIAALDAASADLDATFNPGTGFSNAVRSLAVDGTKLYAGGTFTSYQGTNRRRIAALNKTTASLDAAFNAATGFDAAVNTLQLSGAKLYAGGAFTTYKGTARGHIAAVDTATAALDATFVPSGTSFDADVEAIAVDGARIFAGGGFTSYDGVGRGHVAALNATTAALDTTFVPPSGGFDASVETLAVGGGRLYAGGYFTTYATTGRSRIAALDLTSAALDTTYDPGGGFDDWVSAIAIDGSRLYAGGSFFEDDEIAQSGFAMFETCDRSTFCGDEILRDYVSISTPTSVDLGAGAAGTSSVAPLAVTVQSNAMFGYTLSATDGSDANALDCTVGGCAGSSIADWPGTGSAPTLWPDSGANYGFGVTVLDSTLAPKDATRWGSGITAGDFADNRYAGLDQSISTTLHATRRYIANTPDVTTISVRVRVAPTQIVGSYSGTVSLTAVANP